VFGIGAFEFFAVLVVAIIVLGPDRLPKAMGQVGRWLRELRRITREFREEFSEEIELLQGEIANIRKEAELTRQELQEIQADIRQSMEEVQGDLQQAGDDMRSELSGAERDLLSAQTTPVTSVATRPSLALPGSTSYSPRPPASNGPELDPSDAVFLAIQETFAGENGRQLPARPLPAIESPAPVAGLAAGVSAPEPAALELREPPPRFAPQSDQFGALLSVVARAGGDTAASAESVLVRQAAADAAKLDHLVEKGAAGIGFAWAAQRQAAVEDGSIEIDTSQPGTARLTLRQCPFGFSGPGDLAACSLSNAYDVALARALGAEARYEERMTEGAPSCMLVIEADRASEDGAEAAAEPAPAEGFGSD